MSTGQPKYTLHKGTNSRAIHFVWFAQKSRLMAAFLLTVLAIWKTLLDCTLQTPDFFFF